MKKGARAVLRRADFPALAAFATGYLHEDFREEYGSLEGAAQAFRADADVAERRALATELDVLAAAADTHSAHELRRFLTEDLRSRWTPGSKEDVATLRNLVRAT